MQNNLIDAISSGLHGRFTHIDPQKALVGLTPKIARKKPQSVSHFCWELLHHTVIWQETFLNQIKGEILDWNEIEDTINWPTQEAMKDDSDLQKLLDRFRVGIEETKNLMQTVDFTQTSVGKPALSIVKLFLCLLQHMSLHVGQIVTVRQCLGDWPPKQVKG